EIRIATLEKRAKASSMNSPPKACRAPPPFRPIQAASTTSTAAVIHSTRPATRSLPVQTPARSATIAKSASRNSGRTVEKSAEVMVVSPSVAGHRHSGGGQACVIVGDQLGDRRPDDIGDKAGIDAQQQG